MSGWNQQAKNANNLLEAHKKMLGPYAGTGEGPNSFPPLSTFYPLHPVKVNKELTSSASTISFNNRSLSPPLSSPLSSSSPLSISSTNSGFKPAAPSFKDAIEDALLHFIVLDNESSWEKLRKNEAIPEPNISSVEVSREQHDLLSELQRLYNVLQDKLSKRNLSALEPIETIKPRMKQLLSELFKYTVNTYSTAGKQFVATKKHDGLLEILKEYDLGDIVPEAITTVKGGYRKSRKSRRKACKSRKNKKTRSK